MESVADSLEMSLDQLTLYLTSEEGLLLVAQCELSLAVRTRIAASAQLHNAIDALGMMLQEYANGTRRTLMDESRHSTHVLREEQRANARRAAHLLFRLAHFTPRPIKSYTPAPPPLGGGGAAALSGGGGFPCAATDGASLPSTPSTALPPSTPAAAPSVPSVLSVPSDHATTTPATHLNGTAPSPVHLSTCSPLHHPSPSDSSPHPTPRPSAPTPPLRDLPPPPKARPIQVEPPKPKPTFIACKQ